MGSGCACATMTILLAGSTSASVFSCKAGEISSCACVIDGAIKRAAKAK
jgi:hypothetical protein